MTSVVFDLSALREQDDRDLLSSKKRGASRSAVVMNITALREEDFASTTMPHSLTTGKACPLISKDSSLLEHRRQNTENGRSSSPGRRCSSAHSPGSRLRRVSPVSNSSRRSRTRSPGLKHRSSEMQRMDSLPTSATSDSECDKGGRDRVKPFFWDELSSVDTGIGEDLSMESTTSTCTWNSFSSEMLDHSTFRGRRRSQPFDVAEQSSRDIGALFKPRFVITAPQEASEMQTQLKLEVVADIKAATQTNPRASSPSLIERHRHHAGRSSSPGARRNRSPSLGAKGRPSGGSGLNRSLSGSRREYMRIHLRSRSAEVNSAAKDEEDSVSSSGDADAPQQMNLVASWKVNVLDNFQGVTATYDLVARQASSSTIASVGSMKSLHSIASTKDVSIVPEISEVTSVTEIKPEMMPPQSSAKAGKVCTLCDESFCGFGSVCKACRKVGPGGGSCHCQSCDSFFWGFGKTCLDCKK